MAQEPDRIREDIEATRSDLARDVDALADRTVPSRVARRRWSEVKEKVRTVSDTVMGTPGNGGRKAKDTLDSATDSVRSTARSAADAVEQAATQTGEKASEIAGNVADTVRRAPAAVADRASGNPIAAGLIAFGVGLLAASLIPATELEKEAGQQLKQNAGDLLEPVREPLMESAQQMKESVSGSVSEAMQDIKETARDAAQATKEQATSSAREATEHTRQAATSGSR